MFIVALMVAVGVLVAAEAPKAPATETKKEGAVEVNKTEATPAAKKDEAGKPKAPALAPALPEPKEYEVKDEVVTDTKSLLMWQRKHADKSMTHKEAEGYCEALTLAGHDDWRLPTISELRTLIVGCQSGTDACKVSDQCLAAKCLSITCSCQKLKGPGENGFYWQVGVWQGEGKYFWSSSIQGGKNGKRAWDVGFNYGNVYDFDRTQKADARCVRNAK